MQDISIAANPTNILFEEVPGRRSFKAIVDCNSFYCSCERLFRPDLKHKPVVVLSNNDGCIVSRSDEAKKIGVEMAGPYFKAKSLIQQHDVAVFSSNYNLYGDLSWRVMETLRMLLGASRVEVYSVDEAFVNLPEMEEREVQDYALHIRHTVEQWTGISVSVGVAPSKTLAKAANFMAKENKQVSNCVKVLLSAEQQREALQSIRINNLWGVGGAYAAKLINMGITSAWELRNMSVAWAYKNMGGVTGARLIRELRGEPCIDMKEPLTTKKMIATTRMFGAPVNSISAIKEAIATYTSRAAEKLRRQHSAAGSITVFIVPKAQHHSADFHHGTALSRYARLPGPTAITHELIKAAVQLVDELFEEGSSYKKAGVMLGELVPDTAIQGNLFVPPAGNRNRYLMNMMDNINFSMRDDILKFAAAGTHKNWKMRQELRSRRYTTRWEEMFEVK
ncbi:Y-family DNA polymerase [Agriterribacter sp.]|uniref:Y-family DNA polymerase n=1 Tax=Agriterribacter sp. TaxID=2821509 RepID=UPI002BB40613|nr:Y-family DNA polymerase [Agriterribacter sp.]HTN05275.1 Y-family DNA polymerase [Agriterribacter sp.]